MPSAAVVSAAPELRDFKKEATAFVPASLKRKRGGGTTSKINAAPSIDSSIGEPELATAPRPDLLGTLRSQFGPSSAVGGTKAESMQKPKDDYEKFLEEMGDVLGSES